MFSLDKLIFIFGGSTKLLNEKNDLWVYNIK